MEHISNSLSRKRHCRGRAWKERVLMTKTRQKSWENGQKISVGGWQQWKLCNVGYHLSRGNSSSHHLPLLVQNTLLLTYFPFYRALISLPRIHLVANTESDIAHVQRSAEAEQEHIILLRVASRTLTFYGCADVCALIQLPYISPQWEECVIWLYSSLFICSIIFYQYRGMGPAKFCVHA